MEYPRFRPVADRAVQVDFAESLSDAAHAAVLRLDRAIAQAPPAGVTETVPAYVNLLVVFDPLVTDHAAVTAALQARLSAPDSGTGEGRSHVVDVCYDGDLARDLPEVAARTGLAPEDVIAAHLQGDYRVYLYGFAPGYAYLAGVLEAIRLPRKPAPVRNIPAGSVIIAGPQCIVTTLTMPTGWWVIGRSPARILTGDADRPVLFDVGDRIRFRRIGRAAFDATARGAP